MFGSNRGINFKEGGGSIKNLGTISSLNETVVWDATTPGNLTIINSGLIAGVHSGVTLEAGSATIVNTGTIRGDDFSIISGSATHLTNSGKLEGGVLFGDGADTFADFKKVGHVIKNGTVSGVIDLGNGDDHFNGGASSETVRDGNGSDVYKLGGGNDIYISGVAGGANDVDTVDGGNGVDTYDASHATASVTVTLSPPFASGTDIGFDNITGFENAIGGSGNDFLFGSNAANTLIGGAGGDELKGFGGRDILTGGADADKFFFDKLSDSGITASTRDVITDFTQGQDHIDLSAIDAKTGGLDDEFSFIGGSNFGHHKGELRESFSKGDSIRLWRREWRRQGGFQHYAEGKHPAARHHFVL